MERLGVAPSFGVEAKEVSMAKKTFVAFLLDETGSMNECKQATIEGYNEYVKTLKEDNGRYRFSLTKFDSEHITPVYDKVKLDEVEPLTDETYRPGALTPLYDAIARVIKATEKTVKKEQVLVVILTDGLENASHEYTREAVFSLIKDKEKEGWEFLYLGSNQDAWKVASSIGIKQDTSATYQPGQEKLAFAAAAASTRSYSKGGSQGLYRTMRGSTDAVGNLVEEDEE